MSLASLREKRKQQTEALATALQNAQGTNKRSQDDERYWKPTLDASGNGFAIIRFLPSVESEDVPFVQYWEHISRHPVTKQWYIERSLTTLGLPDPMSEYNVEMWNKGDAGQSIARAMKRKLSFVSNIYVVKDPGNPENEGKVFLFKYGKVIYDMLNTMMFPTEPDIERVDPFDLWEGANFRFRIRTEQVGASRFPKYNTSTFDRPAPLASDEEMEAIYKKVYPLQPIIARDQFKTYDELKARVLRVTGGDTRTMESPSLPSAADELPSAPPPKAGKSSSFDDFDDDPMAEFQALADLDDPF